MKESNVPYFKSWILYFLIASIGGGVIGMIVGAVIGGAMGAAGLTIEQIAIVTGLIGLILGVPISFFTFRWSVGRYIVEPMVRALRQQE